MRSSETPPSDNGRIEVEPELLQRAKLQSAILDNAGYAIIATDPVGTITEFNPAAERMLGYSADEMIGRATPVVMHLEEEVVARARQFGRELGIEVSPDFDTFVVKARLGLPNEHEWTYVRKDGSRLSVLLNVTGLKGACGEITGYLGIASDITRRKQADDELRASEEKLRKLFELSPLGIVLTSLDGRYLEFNDAFRRLTGYSREELLNLDYWTLTPEEYANQEQEQLLQLERHGRYGPYLKDYVTKSGVRTPLRLNGMTLTGPDGQTYIWSIVEDISADLQARAELVEARARAEAANLAKSEFLANMSHEIRTPLNGVAGVAGALARTPLADAQREMVSIIENSARTLETLLSDILDLARVEAGKFELRPEPFDLGVSVRACAALFDAAAQAKGLDLEVDIAPEADGWYLGDAARIRQILSNLLGNAVKFTASGHIALYVGRTVSGLEFRVSDTGIGFDAETKNRLFARFEQADGSITRRFGGSGLGLAISRALADAMGGALDAHAEPGRGAVFTFALDLPPADAPADPPTATGEVDEAEVGGLKVLLAEDHPTNRRVVELILGSAGVDLVCVENGAEAVAAFSAGDFDMVLMDVQMPVMDGLTAVREIRAREMAGRLPRTPIFVLTANAMPEHVSASRAAGADGHVTKPINPDELLRVVGGGAASAISTPAA